MDSLNLPVALSEAAGQNSDIGSNGGWCRRDFRECQSPSLPLWPEMALAEARVSFPWDAQDAR